MGEPLAVSLMQMDRGPDERPFVLVERDLSVGSRGRDVLDPIRERSSPPVELLVRDRGSDDVLAGEGVSELMDRRLDEPAPLGEPTEVAS